MHDREQRQRKAAGMVRQLGSTAYCEVCGQPYEVTGSLQRYCPDCAPVIVREHSNAQSRAWYAVNLKPDERRAVRQASKAKIPCMVCGRMFVPTGPERTCSEDCSQALRVRSAKDWEARNRETRNAYRRALRAEKLAAMSDVEKRAYRDKANAKARENYKKRKEREDS